MKPFLIATALSLATFPGLPPALQATALTVPVILPSSPVWATVTAYTSSPDETDDTPFITASGKPTGDGEVACPIRYPFGTRVYIEGKLYVCWDRMNARYQNEERWDVWMATKAEAGRWGTRVLKIEVVDESSKEVM